MYFYAVNQQAMTTEAFVIFESDNTDMIAIGGSVCDEKGVTNIHDSVNFIIVGYSNNKIDIGNNIKSFPVYDMSHLTSCSSYAPGKNWCTFNDEIIISLLPPLKVTNKDDIISALSRDYCIEEKISEEEVSIIELDLDDLPF